VVKDSIPDWHSVLNLLDVFADYFMLDVVQHTNTQKHPVKRRELREKMWEKTIEKNSILVGMSGQMFLVVDVEIRISIVFVILTPVIIVQDTDSA
jgi:hypothetical protein